MNQLVTTNRNLRTQGSSKPSPWKAPGSQVLLQASPFAVSHDASPKILQAQLRPHLLWGTRGPWARLTSSLHPHIHRSGTGSRGKVWAQVSQPLRSLDDPFQGWMAGGMCSYL